MERRSRFTVKSCYRLLAGECEAVERLGWTGVWDSRIPPKVKTFIWQAYSECLATSDVLRSRRVNYPNLCRLCNTETETCVHLFFHYTLVRACWGHIGVSWDAMVLQYFYMGIHHLGSIFGEECFRFGLVLCWSLWHCRNEIIWNEVVESVDRVFYLAQSFWKGWCKANGVGSEREGMVCIDGVLAKTGDGEMENKC